MANIEFLHTKGNGLPMGEKSSIYRLYFLNLNKKKTYQGTGGIQKLLNGPCEGNLRGILLRKGPCQHPALMRINSPLTKCQISLIPLETYWFKSPMTIVWVTGEK